MIDYVLPFLFLASGITANKLILGTINPGLLVGLRMLIAGIILLAMALYQNGWTFIAKIKKQWPYLLLLSAFSTFIPAILKAYALKHAASSKVALIGSLDPFLTALYAYILFQEKLTLKKWLGILLGFVGIILVIIVQSGESCTIWGPLSCAEFAAFCSICVSRYGWIKVQQLLKAHIFSVKEINGLLMFIASLYSLGCTAIFTPTAFAATWSTKNVLLLFYTIVAGNIIGYSLYSHLLKKHSATFVALAGFTVPVFVYLFGWLFVGEPLYPSFLIASAVTFAGLLLFYKDEIVALTKTQPRDPCMFKKWFVGVSKELKFPRSFLGGRSP